MDTLVSSETYGNTTVEIHIDLDAPDPRQEFDRAGVLVLFHRWMSLGDSHPFTAEDDLPKDIYEYYGHGSILIPVYGMDHGAFYIRAGRSFSDVDPGGWDSGFLGWAVMPEEIIEGEFGGDRKMAVASLRGEIEEYAAYVSGDVFGYVVINKHGEEVESCWGFYGTDLLEKEVARVARWYEEVTPDVPRNAFYMA